MQYTKTIIITGLAAIFLSGFSLRSEMNGNYITDAKVINDTIKAAPVAIDSLTTEVEPVVKFLPFKKNAHASFYADKFNGRRTASGKRFSNNKLTAAHKKLPFGTLLRLTNEDTGKTVIVEVTDRGPFSTSREIDISKKAFNELGSKGHGSVNVTIEIVSGNL